MRNRRTSIRTAGANEYTLNRVGTSVLGASNFYLQQASSVSAGSTPPPSTQFTASTTLFRSSESWRMNSASLTPFGDTVTISIVVPQGQTTTQYDRTAAVNYARKYAL